MGARASEYTFAEAERLRGRRFRLLFKVGDLPAEAVVQIGDCEPWGNGYAVFGDVLYCPDKINMRRLLLTLRDVRDNLVEC